MRHKGRITGWQDDRGFGFITPMLDGNPVFVHIKSFMNRGRRPVDDDLVTYVLKHDSKGRLQAANVKFSDERTSKNTVRASMPGPGAKSLLFAVAFLVLVAVTVVTGMLPVLVLWFYIGVSGIAYVAYAWDKSSARLKLWRTPEDTLHFIDLLGGWPGAFIAQKHLRHKSRKPEFQERFWVTVVLNCVAFIWLLLNPDILR